MGELIVLDLSFRMKKLLEEFSCELAKIGVSIEPRWKEDLSEFSALPYPKQQEVLRNILAEFKLRRRIF